MKIVMPFGAMFTDRFGRKFFQLAVKVFAATVTYWFFKAAPDFIVPL
jgi:MHS family proline/betaine transporter-like MFS transporter